jgi:hypothetical protein
VTLATAALALLLVPAQQVEITKSTCPWYTEETVEALAESLMSLDPACNSHAQGYVEGIFDAGARTLFAAPTESVTLADLRVLYLVVYQDDVLRRDAFAAAGLIWVFKKRFGEVNDEEVHE